MANEPRTTIGVKKQTKDRLDANRAPGQCYDGFICQLVDLWERAKNERARLYLNPSRKSQELQPELE